MLEPKKQIKNITPYEIASYYPSWDMKLDANENYIGPSTKVLKAIKDIPPEKISTYPCYGRLYDKLSGMYEIEKSCFVLTNGADEALSAAINTYISENDRVLSVTPSFSMPQIYTKIAGAHYIEIPYSDKWTYPAEAVISAIDDSVKAVIITTPNNPTADIVPENVIKEIVQKCRNIPVIIDETYANFSGVTNIRLVEEYDNVIIVKSFSKDYALAGLRLGYVVSNAQNIENIKKCLSPYNVNAIAVEAAIAALSDNEYLNFVVNEISQAKQYLTEELTKLGVRVYKSYTNFLLADFGIHKDLIFNMLKENRIIVKDFKSSNVLKNSLRITIPTLSAAKRLISLINTKITLVFDMDGVLVDVTNSYYEAIKYTYNYFTGKTITTEQIVQAKKQGGLNNDWDLTSYLIEQSGFKFSYEKIVEVFQSQYWNDGSGSINKEKLLIDERLLRELSQKYNLAVFTGRPRQEALYTLNKFNIRQYFEKIVTMDDLPSEKQKPDIEGLKIIKNAFITEYLIYFGDTVDDAKCASNMPSAYGVGVLPPSDKSDDLKEILQNAGAKRVINNINEIKIVLESITDENSQIRA